MTGTGLGLGHPELIGFAGRSDFILTAVGEELGLAGLMAVFLLYALLAERGLRAALLSRDPFGKLLAMGLASALALQVFVVAAGVTGLMPLTGKALPFLAQGGSSMLANWVLVALLLKVSDHAQRAAGAPPHDDREDDHEDDHGERAAGSGAGGRSSPRKGATPRPDDGSAPPGPCRRASVPRPHPTPRPRAEVAQKIWSTALFLAAGLGSLLRCRYPGERLWAWHAGRHRQGSQGGQGRHDTASRIPSPGPSAISTASSRSAPRW